MIRMKHTHPLELRPYWFSFASASRPSSIRRRDRCPVSDCYQWFSFSFASGARGKRGTFLVIVSWPFYVELKSGELTCCGDDSILFVHSLSL